MAERVNANTGAVEDRAAQKGADDDHAGAKRDAELANDLNNMKTKKRHVVTKEN